jgi:phospholipase D1/2
MVQARTRLLLSALFLALLGLSALIAYSYVSHVDASDVSARLAQDRYAWWAPVLVVLVFVGFSVVPVMLLVSLTGIAFGPVLGPLYAMTGCLASASTAFAIGRWIGPRNVNGWGGERTRRLMGMLRRNGTLAVFLIRKIPMPFVLVNVMLGASPVGYREFLIGTALGMAAMVVALAGFGYQLAETWRHPSMESVTRALLFLCIPLSLAWMINRRLRALQDLQDLQDLQERSGDAWSV